MNTFVVLAGLMLIVPRTDPQGNVESLTVLVLETETAGSQYGHPMQPHLAVVAGGTSPLPPRLSGDWTIHSPGRGGIQIHDQGRLFRLGDVYGASAPKLDPNCLGDDYASSCVDGTRRKVAARVELTGGWRVRPLEVDSSRAPRADVMDDTTWGVLQVRADGKTPVKSGYERQLSAAVLLEPTGGGSVSIEQGGAKNPLGTLAVVPDCMQAVGVAGPCSIVRFLNTLGPTHSHGPTFDPHHNLIYDIYDPAPEPRYLLFISKPGSDGVMKKLGYKGLKVMTPYPRACIPPAFAVAVPSP